MDEGRLTSDADTNRYSNFRNKHECVRREFNIITLPFNALVSSFV